MVDIAKTCEDACGGGYGSGPVQCKINGTEKMRAFSCLFVLVMVGDAWLANRLGCIQRGGAYSLELNFLLIQY